MGKPFLSEIEALAGVRISGDNTPLILDFDDGSAPFEASIFADSDGSVDEVVFDIGGSRLMRLGVPGLDETRLAIDSGGLPVTALTSTAGNNTVLSNESSGAIFIRPNGRSSNVRELSWGAASDTPQFRDAGGARDMWHAGNLPIEVKYFSNSGAIGGSGVINVDWDTPFNTSYVYWLSARVQGFRSEGTVSYRWMRTGLAVQTGGAASQGEYTEIADAGYGSGDTVFVSTSIATGPDIRFQIQGDGSLFTPLTYNVNAMLFGIKVV